MAGMSAGFPILLSPVMVQCIGIYSSKFLHLCAGPPNLSLKSPGRKLLNRQPLLYPATGDPQELVLGGYHAHHASTATYSSSQGLAGLR
jgi:hypothetical protein